MFAVDLAAVTAWAAPVLLIASGAAKLRRPAGASRALVAARLPSGARVVRTLAGAEASIGVAFVLRPAPVTAALLAALYVAFAVVLVALLRRPAEASTCGCLGERQTPPSRLHVGMDLIAAAAAIAVATLAATGSAPPSFLAEAGRLGWRGVPFVVGVGLAAWLGTLAVAHLPNLFGAWRAPA